MKKKDINSMKNLGLKMVEERIRKLEGGTEEFTQDKGFRCFKSKISDTRIDNT